MFGIFCKNVIDIRSKSRHNREEKRDRYRPIAKRMKLPPRGTEPVTSPFRKGGEL
jgi:hypothetical protein